MGRATLYLYNTPTGVLNQEEMMNWSKLGEKLSGKQAKKRIRKETGQDEPYERDENWVESLSDSDRRRYEAVEKGNKKKKGFRYEDGGTCGSDKARRNVLMKISGKKKK